VEREGWLEPASITQPFKETPLDAGF